MGIPERFLQVPEVCRKLGISEQIFYRRRRRYGGLGWLRNVVNNAGEKLENILAGTTAVRSGT